MVAAVPNAESGGQIPVDAPKLVLQVPAEAPPPPVEVHASQSQPPQSQPPQSQPPQSQPGGQPQSQPPQSQPPQSQPPQRLHSEGTQPPAFKKGDLVEAANGVTKANVRKRLNRLFAPRVDGSYQVPESLALAWKDDANKDQMIQDYIDTGLSKASFLKSIWLELIVLCL